jgi:hypothetical protein
MFADERWIDVSDPRLLDHENAQFVLIGAREDGEPPGVDLDGDADPFATFRLDAEAWPEAPLREGSFAAPEREAEPVEAAGDRSKGGKRGGRAAARVDSAAGVASALDGVSFPAGRSDLIGRARENDAPPEVVELLREMPDERFGSMADVAKAIGEVR